jgi:TonB family protein
LKRARWPHPFLLLCALSSAAVMCTSSAYADDDAALRDRLHVAEQASTLSGDTMLPYYLKMTAQLFDKKGVPGEQGTVEVYWAGVGREKRVYAFPSYSATEVRTNGKLFRTPDAVYPPALAQLLVEQVLDPMPTAAEIDQSQPQIKTVKFGKVPLECIMLGQPIQGIKTAPMGLFPTYCFDPGKDILRVGFNYGTQFVTRNSIATFQQRTMAESITVSEGSVPAAKGQVATVSQRAITDADMATDGLQEIGYDAPVKVASGVTQGLALSQPAPTYPEDAKEGHIQGLVVLHALIGKDGHILSLRVVSGAVPSLAVAAIAAVRQWTYRPYMLNGVPVEVETTINVNFTFN